MTVLGFDEAHAKKVLAAFPDMFGLTREQIAALPPYIQYFKCEGKIEAGEPGCDANKFNNTMCAQRNGKTTSWYPGWKYHALVGHMMAFTVLQIITESLEGLIKLEPKQPEATPEKLARIAVQLQQLDAAEQADYENIFTTSVPDNILQRFEDALWTRGNNKEESKAAMKHMSLEMFIKEATFCHTAMLPAEIRYNGLLTGNPENVGDAIQQNYVQGVLQSKVQALENPDPNSGITPKRYIESKEREEERNMLIGKKDSEYQSCSELLNVDFKDYFLVTSLESWRSVRFPTVSQKAYYTEFDMQRAKGWIFVCMAKCKLTMPKLTFVCVYACGWLAAFCVVVLIMF
jgi:hypothetical protein